VTICRHCGAALNNRDHDCEGGLCEACLECRDAHRREHAARDELAERNAKKERDRQLREARKMKKRMT